MHLLMGEGKGLHRKIEKGGHSQSRDLHITQCATLNDMIIIIICGLFFDIHLSLGGRWGGGGVGWGYSSFPYIIIS